MSTHSNIIINRFNLKNPNMIVLGQSGAGKSFTAKMEMIRWLMLGVPITVIDPQNEYQRMCEYLGGQFISISVNSEYKINPLDFSFSTSLGKDVITEKIQNINKLLSSMVSEGMQEHVAVGLNAEQRSIVDEVLLKLYANYGYFNYDPESQQNATPEKMPLFSDLHDLLVEKAKESERTDAQIQPIVAVLRRYIRTGTLAGLFDRHTNVNLRSNLIVFNVQGLNKDLVGVGMHGILEFVRSTMLTHEQQVSGQKRLLYIDEAHRLMKFNESAGFIEDMAKTVRKFNIGLTVLTQDPEDFLKARDGSIRPEGVNVVRNCAMQMLLSQHKNGIPVIEEIFDLTESEADYLTQAEKGEGMLLAEEEHAWISMRDMASPLEHQLITTNPEEVAAIEAQRRAALPQAVQGSAQQQVGANSVPQAGQLPPPAPVSTEPDIEFTTFAAPLEEASTPSPVIPEINQSMPPISPPQEIEKQEDVKPKPQVEVKKITESDDLNSFQVPDDLF